jgi:RNA polymerase sigma factor (sigma-70 family)
MLGVADEPAGESLRLTPDLVLAAKGGQEEARRRLIEASLPLIATVARPYRGLTLVERSELMQEGIVGLLRGLERYDPARGKSFWAYASWWVREAMQHLVSELTRPVVLSDRASRKLAQLRSARRDLLQAEGREPTNGELATGAGLNKEQVESLLAVERCPRGLDETAAGAGSESPTVSEQLVDPEGEDEYERVTERLQAEHLGKLFGALGKRERTILRGRFGFDGSEQTLRELGRTLDLSSERVRQIEEEALDKLRHAATLARV